MAEFSETLAALYNDFKKESDRLIGFPAASDIDYSELSPFFTRLINNLGDPWVRGLCRIDSKAIEKEVVEFFCDLLRAPVSDRWGYVTSGSTEGNLYGMYLGREVLPRGAVVYYSESAHYSVGKNVHILGLPGVVIKAQQSGEMDYQDLQQHLAAAENKPALIVATIGTTMTEARDNIATIKQVLNATNTAHHHIHSDAALVGGYAHFMDSPQPFDFADGADTIAISGHKFLGAPMPCGLALARRSLKDRVASRVSYTASPDTTISGSRNGQAALCFWYAIQKLGLSGFKERYLASRAIAEYTEYKLHSIGWDTWRNDQALTVMLRQPPQELCYKWQLASSDGWSHIICMPGVTRAKIDVFVNDLI